MKITLKTLILSIVMLFLSACSQKQEVQPQEFQFKTVMECVNDAKLKDRDMVLVGEKVKFLEVEEFVIWYNTTFYPTK